MHVMPQSAPCLDAALEYALQGWHVFPIKPRTKMPACDHGVRDATAISDRVRALWAKCPAAGVGIAGGGPARLVMLDVDHGADGRAALAALETELGCLPPTALALTPRGGEHRYFSFPVDQDLTRVKNSVSKLAPHIDVRAVGGYVVAPPTPGYVWQTSGPVAELPAPWAQRLVSLSSGYADAALKNAASKVRDAEEGTRNDTLNREAFSLGGLVAAGTLSEYVVTETLIAAGVAAGLSATEARQTVASGIRAGMQHPRASPRDTGGVRMGPQSTDEDQTGEAPDWKATLRFDRHGRLTKDPHNALLLLANHDVWSGCLAHSLFSDRIVWTSDPPSVPGVSAPRAGDELAEHHVGYVQGALSALHGASFARSVVLDAVTDAAHEHPRHEVRTYLDALRWDGAPRIGRWLTTYLGAEQTAYVEQVSAWWIISAVARIYQPGCQCDHVLVLSGSQGAGKSSAVRILAGDWYLGSLPDLRDKDAVQVLQGRWLVELGELDALRGAAGTRIKDFLSQTVDVYRPSYGRVSVRRRRQCVFVGTTNEEHYLVDATGARRFWPVPVRQLDRPALARDRDQIWAEAVVQYRQGAPWWPEAIHSQTLEAQQDAHYVGDEWEPIVAAWATTRAEFTIGDVLAGAIKLPTERWDRTAQTRVGIILRRLGFGYQRARKDGARTRVYGKTYEMG